METFLIIGWILSTIIALYELSTVKRYGTKMILIDTVVMFIIIGLGWISVGITIKNWIKNK